MGAHPSIRGANTVAKGGIMTPQRISIIATALAVVSLIVCGLSLLQAAALRASVATLKADAIGAESDVKPIGSGSLDAEHALDAPHVVRDPADVPSPIRRTKPTTVALTLTVKELTAEIADGASYAFWTFDGTVPGPMIRVMEGDTVKLTLVNPATNQMPHNIDLHAVNGPGGGAAVTNVNPGESKTFTFKAMNRGVYVYHCAGAPPYHHIAQGLYGAIVVEPPGGLPKVDREFYVMQGEWYTVGSRR
jgi:FtsP/CotA-like multicopper oxidase with cupredoxin domain